MCRHGQALSLTGMYDSRRVDTFVPYSLFLVFPWSLFVYCEVGMSEYISEKKAEAPEPALSQDGEDHAVGSVSKEGELLNVSGHVQELDRSFGFWSVASLGILSDNAWAAGGGSLVVS